MIHAVINFFHQLTDPHELSILIDTVFSGWWIYILVSAIVFAETGILLGFVLPGDSLLFTLGVVSGTGKVNLGLLLILLIISAFVGDNVGYYLGRKTGPKIFSRPDSLIFKQAYIQRTQAFFEKYGGKTLIFARFVPIVRSFSPFMAGVGMMPYNRFLKFSIAGCTIWVSLLTLMGYSLGNVSIIKNNFEKAILIVIILSFVPAVIEYMRHRRGNG